MHKNLSMIVVALLLVAAPGSAATVKVKQNRTPMRAEATITSAVVAYYQSGDVLELMDALPGWYKVRDLRTKQEGYILTTLAELLPGPLKGTDEGRAGADRPAPKATTASSGSSAKAKAPLRKTWTDLGYIAVDGAYLAGGSAFSDTFTFPKYREQATITTEYPKKDGPTFDVGGAVRVWRNLAFGLAVSAAKRSTTGVVSGSIPHPFFFNVGRPVSGSTSVKHDEIGVHLGAAYVIPAGRKMLVSVVGGPSFFSIKQSLVDSVQYSESFPYDTALLKPVTPTQVSKSRLGFNAGLDVGYYFSKAVGVGVLIRYAGATFSLPIHGETVSVKAGGVQAGVGLRLRIPKAAPKKVPTKTPGPAGPVKK